MSRRSIVPHAIRLLRCPLDDIADQMGVAYDTVKNWSCGRSTPTPENQAKLIALLKWHAKSLREAAADLEGNR